MYDSNGECLDGLAARGHVVFCARSSAADSESVFEAELPEPRFALVVGNERDGLSPAALARADRRLHVPMAGMTTSYNLSVTAALCLFAFVYQRQRASVEGFLLPDAGRAPLRARFLEPLLERGG